MEDISEDLKSSFNLLNNIKGTIDPKIKEKLIYLINSINEKINSKRLYNRLLIKDLIILNLLDIKLDMIKISEIKIKKEKIDDFNYFFNYFYILLSIINETRFNNNDLNFIDLFLREKNKKNFLKNLNIENSSENKEKPIYKKILLKNLEMNFKEKIDYKIIYNINIKKEKLLGLKKAFEMVFLDIIYQNDLSYKLSKNIPINNHPFYIAYNSSYINNDIFHLLLFFIFYNSEKFFLKDLILFIYYFELKNLNEENKKIDFIKFIIEIFFKKNILSELFFLLTEELFFNIDFKNSLKILNIIGQFLVLKFSSIVHKNIDLNLQVIQFNDKLRSVIFFNSEFIQNDEIIDIEFVL